MKKTGIFYGSLTGTTADVAGRIAKELGVAEADVHDVAKTAPAKLGDYDVLVLGTSTWGDGEVEQDWYDFLDGAQSLDLKDKKMALFGCGDETMSQTFCNGVAEIFERLRPTGVDNIGSFANGPYEFEESTACGADGNCLGLVLDEVNHADASDERIRQWCDIVRKA